MSSRLLILLVSLSTVAVFGGEETSVTTGQKSRHFELSYTATIKDVPAGAASVDLWLPVPQTDAYQEIGKVSFDSKIQPELAVDPVQNNKIAHWKLKAEDAKAFTVTMSVDCTRHEIVTPDLSKARELTDEEKATFAPYLKANRLVLVGGDFTTIADNATKGAKTPVEIAKAAYDYAVTTMKYDKPKDKPGWGTGSTKWACDAKFGNCTDFHAMVMSIGRTKGVPVKFEIGFPIPEDSKAGPVGGHHCWAKSYLGGVGWMPVDASEAQKHPEKKDYFCGSLCPNRIHFTTGRDVDLVPKQAGDALNYFVYPYAEADGKSIAVDKKFDFKDL